MAAPMALLEVVFIATRTTIPETELQYHHHEGVDVPVFPADCYLREPGEEPKWVQMGTNCVVCGHTEGPVAVRMHIEAMMGFK